MVTLRRRHSVLIVSLVVAVSVVGASTAQAFWPAGGFGSGSASTGTAAAVQLSAGVPLAGLRPGGQNSVSLVVSNPNPSIVRLNSLVLDGSRGTGGFAVDAAHASGCSLTALLSFTSQTNGGSGWSVPAAVGATAGTLAVALPNALTMSSAAPSGCQGATFTVYLAVGA